MITQERLMEKIGALPASKLSEVEDFVDFLSSRTPPHPSLTDEEKDAMIARYAAEFGGTEFDIDEDLIAAGLEAIAEDKEVSN